MEFVEEACKHCKSVAGTGEAVDFLQQTRVAKAIADQDPAVVVGKQGAAQKVANAFVKAISQHRNWDRELKTLSNG